MLTAAKKAAGDLKDSVDASSSHRMQQLKSTDEAIVLRINKTLDK